VPAQNTRKTRAQKARGQPSAIENTQIIGQWIARKKNDGSKTNLMPLDKQSNQAQAEIAASKPLFWTHRKGTKEGFGNYLVMIILIGHERNVFK